MEYSPQGSHSTLPSSFQLSFFSITAFIVSLASHTATKLSLNMSIQYFVHARNAEVQISSNEIGQVLRIVVLSGFSLWSLSVENTFSTWVTDRHCFLTGSLYFHHRTLSQTTSFSHHLDCGYFRYFYTWAFRFFFHFFHADD